MNIDAIYDQTSFTLTLPFSGIYHSCFFFAITTHTHTTHKLFSSPIDVTTVGKITAMAVDASSNGVITRDTVNNGQPRKQGFFNETGKPILYDDLLFIDGTQEIEKLVASSSSNENDNKNKTKNKNKKQSSSVGMPSNEGAGIGKRPYLFPIPVTIAFLLFFWSVATEQFVTPIVTDIAATTVLL